MPRFEVNTDNALKAISKVNFTDDERFNEFIGGLSSEAKTFIHVDTIDVMDTIIVCGDDLGFTKENRASFYRTYDSSIFGLGEHGQGVRAAFNYFIKSYTASICEKMKEDKRDIFFGVISYNTTIGWTIIKIYDNGRNEGFDIEYTELEEDQKYILLFRKYLNTTGTMFLIPNIMESCIDKCIQNYKLMLNRRIFKDKLIFKYNKKEITLSHELISDICKKSNYYSFKIRPVRARIKNNGERKGRTCDMFIFDPDPFNQHKTYLYCLNHKDIIKYTEDKIIIENLDQHKYIDINSFILCEICNTLDKNEDYAINNLAHDCGYRIYKNDIGYKQIDIEYTYIYIYIYKYTYIYI